jgi:hypothetical protein
MSQGRRRHKGGGFVAAGPSCDGTESAALGGTVSVSAVVSLAAGAAMAFGTGDVESKPVIRVAAG